MVVTLSLLTSFLELEVVGNAVKTRLFKQSFKCSLIFASFSKTSVDGSRPSAIEVTNAIANIPQLERSVCF
jgi:hypothetical protein